MCIRDRPHTARWNNRNGQCAGLDFDDRATFLFAAVQRFFTDFEMCCRVEPQFLAVDLPALDFLVFIDIGQAVVEIHDVLSWRVE